MSKPRRKTTRHGVISQFIDDVESMTPVTDRDARLKGVVRLLAKIAIQDVQRGRISESDALDIMTVTFPINDGNYDATKGRYTTYMGRCLRLHLRDPRHRRGGAHIPDSAWTALFALEKARIRYIEDHGLQPSHDDLAEATGLSRGRVDVLMGARSIAFRVSVGDKPNYVVRSPSDDDEPDAPERAWVPAVTDEGTHVIPPFARLVSGLPAQQRKVLHMRYVRGMTLGSIGRVYGVTGERIRVIQGQAIRALRNRLHPSYEEVVR